MKDDPSKWPPDVDKWRGKQLASPETYRQACFDLALAAAPKIVVEVGVYGGALSRKLVLLPAISRLFLVDSWKGATADRKPPFFLQRDQKHMDKIASKVKVWASTNSKIKVLHMPSIDAAPLFEDESVDFFHTDGDHTLEGVVSDIEAWLPKVRVGGILSGDNYEMPTVAEAVDRLLPNREFVANGRLWWARK